MDADPFDTDSRIRADFLTCVLSVSWYISERRGLAGHHHGLVGVGDS